LITDKGLEILSKLQGPIDEIIEQFSFISVSDTKKFNQVLDEIRNINNPS